MSPIKLFETVFTWPRRIGEMWFTSLRACRETGHTHIVRCTLDEASIDIAINRIVELYEAGEIDEEGYELMMKGFDRLA